MEETHHWNACIESILGILEDRLVRFHNTGNVATKQSSRKSSRRPLYSASCWKIPINGNQPLKRKRPIVMDPRDRKMIRTSTTGSSLMLRDINRTPTIDTKPTLTAPPIGNKGNHWQQPMAPMKTIPIKNSTKKHHFNISSNTKSKLDQWLLLQAQHTNDISPDEPNTMITTGIDIKQCTSTETLEQYQHQLEMEINTIADQLKSPSSSSSYSQQQYLTALKNDLVHFSNLIRKWLGLGPYKSLQTLFPDWPSLEDYVYGMMGYIKAHEMMYQLSIVPRTNDLLGDIHHIQSILDDCAELLGTQLVMNGCLWKEMGWWVEQSVLDATKQQFMNICCIGLQDELSNEISKHGYTEKMMECTVCGLELMSSASELIGRTLDQEQIDFCRPLVVLYAQWTNQEIQSHGQHHYKNSNRTSRTDLRILQLVNNMTRVLTAFQSLTNSLHLESNDNGNRMGTLASLLVDIVFNVVSIIDQQSLTQTQPYIKRSNIMRNTFLPTLYLEQSLVTFADGVVELSDKKTQGYTKRIKVNKMPYNIGNLLYSHESFFHFHLM
ncbi:hypothetical protein BCR42DRAFT_414003 [Absidia repens]|uniref:Uncharacterized protein n=1 Tax=Absidia repens TaxID=90262 RepID=A0A1X2IIM0_9FUNG|nr:hypothetical protein BCR42DRAFT_414003 [Absidia repens]